MAYIRTRTTSSGSPSTALVESYRDDQGRPRQRALANLHGMPDVLSALAKLAGQRDRLRKERDSLTPQLEQANQFYEVVMSNTMAGHQYTTSQRKEIDGLLRARKRLLKRAEAIKATLAVIQKDGAVIRKHCTASESEIQSAIGRYKKELKDAEALALGNELFISRSEADLRRLSMGPRDDNRAFLKQMRRHGLGQQPG